MKIKDRIFLLLNEFNSGPEVNEYLEDDINEVIAKYPNIHELFDKYVNNKLNKVEENELYFIISRSKILLSALNQYYNEKIAESVEKKIDQKLNIDKKFKIDNKFNIEKESIKKQLKITKKTGKGKSLINKESEINNESEINAESEKNEEKIDKESIIRKYVFIDRYQDRLISNFQFIGYIPVAEESILNKKILFLNLVCSDVKFILSLEYKDEKYQVIDNIRIIPLPISKTNREDEKILCQLNIHAGIISLSMKLEESLLIEDVIKIHSFIYKNEVYDFIQYRNISDDNIGYTIEITENLNNRNEFEKFMKSKITEIFSNNSLVLDFIINSKYIKIISSIKSVIIPFSYSLKEDIKDVIDYLCNEFKI